MDKSSEDVGREIGIEKSDLSSAESNLQSPTESFADEEGKISESIDESPFDFVAQVPTNASLESGIVGSTKLP
jgi:hypothetical protein